MAVLTNNYKLTKPVKNEYYNIDIFNANMDKIDKALNTNAVSIDNLPIKKMTTKISVDISVGDCIVVAEKGWYSNGSALIIIEASGALKHHSLVLSVSSSFYSDNRQISCLSNSNYSKQLFKAASVETVYNKDSKVYLTLNEKIESSAPVDLTVTVISDVWNCCYKILKANEVLTQSTKLINLKAGTANIDLGLGDAAQKNVSDNIDSSNKNLVTGKAVFDEMVKKQNKFAYLVAVRNKVNSDGSCDCDESYVNAADFVFDCTGATTSSYTDTTALNNFLAGLPLGSRVYFAPGSYLINSTIKVPTRLHLEGLNHRATFFAKNDFTMMKIGDGTNQANNVTIKNLYFRKWGLSTLPPTESGGVTVNNFATPIFTVYNGNGIYIEKCGLNNHTPKVSDKEYTSIVEVHGYCSNAVLEKCVLNNIVWDLKTTDKLLTGFTVNLRNVSSKDVSFKFIANFGSLTVFKPKAISSVETTFIGCTGTAIFNEDNVAKIEEA